MANEEEGNQEGWQIFICPYLALHIVVLGDGEEKPAEDRPH